LKRILFILPNLDLGGVETVVMNYFRHINRKKVVFDFVVHGEKGYFEDEAIALGAKIFRAPTRKQSFLGNILTMRKIYKAHKEYDFIIVCAEHSFAFIEMSIAWLSGIKNRGAWSFFSSYQGKSNFKKYLNYAARPFMSLFSNIKIACTKEAGLWLFGKKDCPVLNNAINMEKFKFSLEKREEIREKHGLLGEFVVGIAGRLTNVKNHNFALQVFNEIHRKKKNSAFLIVGNGELMEDLKYQAKKLSIHNNVIFTGSVPEISDYYHAMDALIIPSFHEGLPVVAVEAQASGLKIIISDTLPKEAILSPHACFKSLKSGAASWAEELLEVRSSRCEDLDLSKSGFDIIHEAKRFMKEIIKV